MALSTDYSWKTFKKATSIKGKSRGSNMELVDNALKSYWRGIETRTGTAQELANLLALVKATNTWFKRKKGKKDANLAGERKVKDHFVTRWNTLVALGKASLAEAKQLAANVGTAQQKAALAYEGKKRATLGKQGGPLLKGLQPGYAQERAQYVQSKKTSNPVSGTTVHDMQEGHSAQLEKYHVKGFQVDGKVDAVLNKPFDQLTTADFALMDRFMTQIENDCPTADHFKRHVCFLRKADRLQHMAMVQDGKLVKPDGQLWDTGGQEYMYAVDEYANLFIMAAGAYNADRLRTNHSSILAGKDVLCAGELVIAAGVLTLITNASGHYAPGQNNLYVALAELFEDGLLIGRTKCNVMASANSGWNGVPASELLKAEGNLTRDSTGAFGI